MNCPTCGGGLERWEPHDDLVHYYCAECHPDYTDPLSPLGYVAVLLFLVLVVIIYPAAVVYFKIKGESF